MHKNAFLQADKANLGGPVSRIPSPTTLFKDNSAPSHELDLFTGTENIFLPPQSQMYQGRGRNKMGSYYEGGCIACLRPSKPAPITTITMQEFPDNQVSRNTKNSGTIICSSKFLLEFSGQTWLQTIHFLVCLPHHIVSSTCSTHLRATWHFIRGLWNPSLLPVWEERVGTVHISYHYCQRLKLHYKHQERQKGNLPSVLNPAHIPPTVTRTQGPSCIQCYTPYFCTLLLLRELTIYCHRHETRLGEE